MVTKTTTHTPTTTKPKSMMSGMHRGGAAHDNKLSMKGGAAHDNKLPMKGGAAHDNKLPMKGGSNCNKPPMAGGSSKKSSNKATKKTKKAKKSKKPMKKGDAYCLQCGKATEMLNPETRTTKNGRKQMVGKGKCGHKIFRFI